MIERLRSIVGRRHVLTDARTNRSFRKGYRCGEGPAIAVVRPGSLIELWRVVTICAEQDVAVVMQAANTGLTGGSTPTTGCDRDVVLINTMRIKGITPIRGGDQVVCLPGATLDELERTLKPLGRDPHSVIGSSCFGASVVGGVCNNSGGSLIQRGPAYTELALYARIEADGRVTLVNHLGMSTNAPPEALLARIDQGGISDADFVDEPERRASDHDYIQHVRDIEADGPARFNGDGRRLFEASGSSGKVIVFAVRLDTFPKPAATTTFYIGTNRADDLVQLRRTLLGGEFALPIAAEYIHREAFDLANAYGRDTFAMISKLGTSRLPKLIEARSRIDRAMERIGVAEAFSDRIAQRIGRWLPEHLPRRIRDFRDAYEHHLILRVDAAAAAGIGETLARLLQEPFAQVFECTDAEATAAFLHRFVMAGAAIRYRLIHRAEVEDIISIDYALPRNSRDWFGDLADGVRADIITELRYGHFFCHVVHHDFAVRKGADVTAIKHAMLERLAAIGAACPAEHNVGHLYDGSADQHAFFRALDPDNRLNPGIGKMSKLKGYAQPVDAEQRP